MQDCRSFIPIFNVLIQLIIKISILEAFREPCNVSQQTVTPVSKCPTNLSTYETAAKNKNCSLLAEEAQGCKPLQYHCVLSDDLKYAIEVCAPSINIIDRVCAKFSTEYNSIIRVEGQNCSKCPYSYNSTLAFEYLQCYSNLTQPLTTEHAKSTTAENVTAGGINDDKESTTAENINAGGINDDKESNDGDGHVVIVIVILAAIFVVIAIVALIKRHKIRKHFKCLKADHTGDIEMENRADHASDIEMENRDNLLERGGTTEQFLPENATNNDNIVDSGGATEQPLLESATNNADLTGDIEMENRGISISGEKTPDPSIPEEQNAPKTDIQWMAVLKTKISTTKKDDNILLQIQVNNLLNTLKNPTESWTKDDLVQTVGDLINKLYERKAIDLLEDFGKAINKDENINNTLRICQKEIFKIFDSLEKNTMPTSTFQRDVFVLHFIFILAMTWTVF